MAAWALFTGISVVSQFEQWVMLSGVEAECRLALPFDSAQGDPRTPFQTGDTTEISLHNRSTL